MFNEQGTNIKVQVSYYPVNQILKQTVFIIRKEIKMHFHVSSGISNLHLNSTFELFPYSLIQSPALFSHKRKDKHVYSYKKVKT